MVLHISYKNALDIIYSKISIVSIIREIPILDSVKHVCAQDIYAQFALPKYPISLKDGFALLHVDTNKELLIKEKMTKLTSGFAYEVSTGDFLIEGTSAVIPIEDINFTSEGKILTPEVITDKENVKDASEDIKENELLLSRGDYIRAHNITSLVSQGIKSIKVFKRPKVSILSIGDNLCEVEKQAEANEIYNSNALSLAARILEIGVNVSKIEQCRNSKEEIIESLNTLSKESDFIITTGSMSMHDSMSKSLSNDCFDILFHKVKIAPAGPTALSYLNDTPIIHLPGLPLSCMLGFELLAVPILRVIKNENLSNAKSIFIKNEKEFTCKESCTNAIPGYFDGTAFRSAPSFRAGMLNILAKCNGYALIEDKKTIKEDELVEFFTF